MNNHSSHITTNVIAFCMQNVINLFIMSSHCSHLLQPLDIGVFAPLKYALNKKIDAVNQYNSSCISRIFWIKMYIKAHIKIFFTENLKARWKKTKLILLNLDKILNKLFNYEKSISNQFQTPLEQINLNFLLFNNSSLNGTELREANKLLIFVLNEILNLLDSVQQYTTRLVMITESTHTEFITA